MVCFLLAAAALASSTPISNPDAGTPVDGTTAGDGLPSEGSIVFDARVPAEIAVDGVIMGQLFVAGELKVPAKVGTHDVRIMRNGSPETLRVDVPGTGSAVVLVGRNGTSTGRMHLAPVPADGEVPIEVRVTGSEPLQLRVDGDRMQLSPGDTISVTLATGSHRVSLRSAEGTAVFANGMLTVEGGEAISVLQLAEGRLPEASGAVRFLPSR